MAKETTRNIRLGIFVITGTVLLIAALYLVGDKQNLFGSTFRISAEFYNVNGLMAGNNVRFSGIDVGTVESVEIVSDSSVRVVMVIEDDVRKFIRKNAVASVGTDGLMGNKLVNINSGGDHAAYVDEGDELKTLRPIETDEMVRTLAVTNENMRQITENLKNITDKINSKNTLWSLLMDTIVAENVKASIVSIRNISRDGLLITGNLRGITGDIRDGKGSIGAFISDTALYPRVKQVIVKLERLSDTAALITGDVSKITGDLNKGKGSIGILLKDTSFVHDLNASMENIRKGSLVLNEDLEALKHSFLLRKYFRKQARKTKNKK